MRIDRMGRNIGLFLLTLLILNATWILATWPYLNSDAFRQKLQGPRLSISYSRLLSPFPGVLTFKDFKLKSTSRKLAWQLEFERSTFFLHLLPLRKQEVRVGWAISEGGFLALTEQRPGVDEAKTEKTPEGAGSPSANAPESAPKTWLVHLDDLKFRDMREVRVNELRLVGKGKVAGSIRISKDQVLNIRDLRIHMRDAEGLFHEQDFGRIESCDAHIELLDYRMLETPQIPRLEAELTFAGKLTKLEPFAALLARVDWLKLESASAETEADLRFKEGRFLPGSRILITSEDLSAEFLQQRAFGQGQFTWEALDPTEAQRGSRAQLFFKSYGLQRVGQKEPEVTGEGLSITIESPEARLRERYVDWQADIVLPEAQIHSMAYVNAFFPTGFGFRVNGGTGLMSANLHAESDQSRVSDGSLHFKSKDLAFQYDKIKMKGNLTSALFFDKVDVKNSVFHLRDSTIQMDQLFTTKEGEKSEGEAPWAGKIQIPAATIRVQDPASFDGRLKIWSQDLRPLLALYAVQKDLPRWLEESLNVKDLNIDVKAKADEKNLQLSELRASAEKLKIEGWLTRKENHPEGRLLLSFGSLHGAIGVDGNDYEVKLLGAKEWFAKGKIKL